MKIEFILKCTLTKEDTKDKYIFWDIDGVLAPYRLNGHVADPTGSPNCASTQEIEEGVFITRKPSSFMQHVPQTCGAKENIILSHIRNDKEAHDKEIWIKKNYPSIKHALLITQSKAVVLKDYCKQNNIDLKDVLFIDDSHPILYEAERAGIPSYHVSSFLDWKD